MPAPSTNWINNYSDDLVHLVQQKSSYLMNTVMVDYDFSGEYKYYDQLGASGPMNERTTRWEDTIYSDMNHDRRRLGKKYFTLATLWDDFDQVNQVLNPTSAYTQSLVSAAARTRDDRIIAAVTGNAYSGKEGGTTVSFDANNVITNGGTGMSVAKILETMEILNGYDVDPDEEKYIVLGPKQVTDLMNELKYTSKDYVDFGALQSGKVAPFHGFNLIMSNRLTAAENVRQCLAYCKSGIQMGISRDISVEIDKVPNKNNSIQILVKQALDATRLEEEKTVRIDCSEV